MRARLSELELIGLGDEIWEEFFPRAEAALGEAVDLVVAEAKTNLSRAKGTKLTVAAAGEPPEYDEGELHDSVRPGKVRKTKYSIRKEYGSEHPGAGLHEFGGTITQNGVTRAYPPRPYMRPAEEKVADEIDAMLRDL